MRKNKGITLIALVITIIVLLILAGVAISMLSGENGILKKAAEAKTKTEESQKKEMTTLTDMEIDSHFIVNNSRYKCKNGYITGITVEGNTAKDNVKNLNTALPEGYSVSGEGITDETKLKTGMEIVKDGNVVARTVLFGDIDCDGIVAGSDDILTISLFLSQVNYKREDYEIAAMDINHDGYLRGGSNCEEEKRNDIIADTNIMNELSVSSREEEINQYKYANNVDELIKLDINLIIREFSENLPEAFKNAGYKIECREENGKKEYVITGIKKGTQVKEILNLLPDYNIKIGTNSTGVYTEDSIIEKGANFIVKIEKMYNDVNSLRFVIII